MNEQNFLICLVGLPASGKSTFANKLKNALEKRFISLDVKIIDPDIIRKNIIPDKFEHEKEHIIRSENLKIIKHELEKGNIVISDDLNYYSSMRHDLKDITDTLNLSFFIIHIATPIKICLMWNKKRGKPIPKKVINRVFKRFDNFNRYNWDIPIATFDLSEISNLDDAIGGLLDNLEYNIDALNKDLWNKKSKSNSNIDNEKLDKITRSYVGKILQNSNYLPLKKRIIKLRKNFVKENKNKAFNESEILNSFKIYLEKNLNISLSDNL